MFCFVLFFFESEKNYYIFLDEQKKKKKNTPTLYTLINIFFNENKKFIHIHFISFTLILLIIFFPIKIFHFYYTHSYTYTGIRVNLQLWDTAGQERFRAITQSYYRSAHCLVLVYDISSQPSFDSLSQWCRDIENYTTCMYCIQ